MERVKEFKKIVWSHYRRSGRDLPWRRTRDPYRIFVSEIMLQQTQVSRVIPKYKSFVKRFPSFTALAAASLRDVLAEWKGLGYNRRALNLKRAAEMVVKDFRGKLPKTAEELVKLPGVGPNTAGSLLAFAHNLPLPFIETNIRSAYIHFFFQGKTNIHDRDILPLIRKTLPKQSARLPRSNSRPGEFTIGEWYYALMDYGSWLKREHPNPSRRSAHHARQSPFKGSHRELRSKVLQYVLENSRATAKKAAKTLRLEEAETADILRELAAEGLIKGNRRSFIVE
jgi:A/G-specific adenine glycosylase